MKIEERANKIDKLAEEYSQNSNFNNGTDEYYRYIQFIEIEAFKSGYRKAMEENDKG